MIKKKKKRKLRKENCFEYFIFLLKIKPFFLKENKNALDEIYVCAKHQVEKENE